MAFQDFTVSQPNPHAISPDGGDSPVIRAAQRLPPPTERAIEDSKKGVIAEPRASVSDSPILLHTEASIETGLNTVSRVPSSRVFFPARGRHIPPGAANHG